MLKIITGYLVNTLIPERLHEMIGRSMAKKNANLSKNLKQKFFQSSKRC